MAFDQRNKAKSPLLPFSVWFDDYRSHLRFNSCLWQLASGSHWCHGPNSGFEKPLRALTSVPFREQTPQIHTKQPTLLWSHWARGHRGTSIVLVAKPEVSYCFLSIIHFLTLEHFICRLSSFVSLGKEEPLFFSVLASVWWSQSWLHKAAGKKSTKPDMGGVFSLC